MRDRWRPDADDEADGILNHTAIHDGLSAKVVVADHRPAKMYSIHLEAERATLSDAPESGIGKFARKYGLSLVSVARRGDLE